MLAPVRAGEEQMARWARGHVTHGARGEHLPDFSCCTGIPAPHALAELYAAHPSLRGDLDRGFLGVLIGRAIGRVLAWGNRGRAP